MKKKEKQQMGYLLVGIAAYLLLSKNNRTQQYAPQFQTVPQPPPRNNAQQFNAWASAILNAYGNIAELWQPGGPFHQYKTEDIFDTTTSYYDYA